MNFKSKEMIEKMLTPEQENIIENYIELNSFYEYIVKDTSIIDYTEDMKVQFIYIEDEENTMKFTFLYDGISIIINNEEYIEDL